MMDIETRATLERQRIETLLFNFGVSQDRVALLETVIENVSWMKVKLDDTRESIKTTAVVIPYDNGGGQKGLRENPLFKGYESLFKAYMSGMGKIFDALPQSAVEAETEAIEKPKTVLELVRNKHKKQREA